MTHRVPDLSWFAMVAGIEDEARRLTLPEERFDLIVACTEAAERKGHSLHDERVQEAILAAVERIQPRNRS
jgi:hypothetical protein